MVRAELIAHRGASAYAPENTMQSFELALSQGAGCVEHDLQVTRDGVLVCLHDRTLERTTDVRNRFPRRGQDVCERGRVVRRWFVHDLTLAEIRQLDAGSWFRPAFAGARVPTFDDLLAWAGHRVGVLTEIKDPEVYEGLGIDVLTQCGAVLRRHGFTTASTGAPVTVQSFHEPTVRRAGELFARRIPVVLLIEPADAARVRDREHVAAIAGFAEGIGPGKSIVLDRPEVVEWAHAAGLRVTPWTFRDASVAPIFDSVAAEMAHHLVELGVDAVITDQPDACPRRTQLTRPRL
jgi:glycerophosphoryl diester phosphodiesterase